MELLSQARRFITRGNFSSDTIPPLEGALRPNDVLERAPRHPAGGVTDPSSMVVDDECVAVAAGDLLLRADHGSSDWATVADLGARVTALVRESDGWLAATTGGVLISLDRDGRERSRVTTPGSSPACVTDMAIRDDGSVVIAVGSSNCSADEWYVDLMTKGSSGSIWVSDASSGKSWDLAASGLSWPAGLVALGSDIVVTESWTHRITKLDLTGGTAQDELLHRLPGYPGRIRRSVGGGFWICLYALRTQLVEFVLGEDRFRNAMMAEVSPDFWVRPDFRTRNSGLVPLQGGGLKKLGQTKPWAPARSYGLVLHLGDDWRPRRSFHSRAGGTMHGITAAEEHQGQLYVASRGGNQILTLDVETT